MKKLGTIRNVLDKMHKNNQRGKSVVQTYTKYNNIGTLLKKTMDNNKTRDNNKTMDNNKTIDNNKTMDNKPNKNPNSVSVKPTNIKQSKINSILYGLNNNISNTNISKKNINNALTKLKTKKPNTIKNINGLLGSFPKHKTNSRYNKKINRLYASLLASTARPPIKPNHLITHIEGIPNSPYISDKNPKTIEYLLNQMNPKKPPIYSFSDKGNVHHTTKAVHARKPKT